MGRDIARPYLADYASALGRVLGRFWPRTDRPTDFFVGSAALTAGREKSVTDAIGVGQSFEKLADADITDADRLADSKASERARARI